MKQLFNHGWYFSKHKLGTSLDCICSADTVWTPVELPHDWLIYDTNNLYEDSIGCYRKTFTIDSLAGKRISLLFEGVYMNTTIYVNGKAVGEWKYGYTSFLFDITEFLCRGENTVLVHSVYENPNTRWYSGAGIYRDVYLIETGEVHLVHDGTYITTNQLADGHWECNVCTEMIYEKEVLSGAADTVAENTCFSPDTVSASLTYRLFAPPVDTSSHAPSLAALPLTSETFAHYVATPRSPLLEQTLPVFELTAQAPVPHAVLSCNPDKYATLTETGFTLDNPVVWDIDAPFTYVLETTLTADGIVVDRQFNTFGFRTIELKSDSGFYLNGRHVKLNGACMHHDLGALGAAFNVTALRRQFESLKRMGINAIRTSHNPPAPAFMYLADEMGFLIVSEAFDMWEHPKTKYDYGNFFNDWCERDCASWLRRDRNHPSVIMWSIGNEIYDTHQGRGYEITGQLASYVAFHDPKKNAFSTIGSNYIEWEGAQRCATLLDASGYNYGERLYAQHHADHPEWVIYGSETSSTVQSRSIYHFPASHRLLTHDDHQCSTLGNCSTNWGAKNTATAIINDRDAKFSLGQFIWTGWDYIGEPTPYFTKNSYFGQVDTAGFEKDTYYLYQAEWTDGKEKPMIHLLPYWDFNEGQLIDIRVYSNAYMTELFFNEKSLGTFLHDHENGQQLSGEWQIPYAPGVLKAVAYDENGSIVATDIRSSFGDTAEFRLTPDKSTLKADGLDLIFIDISAYDENGIFVANARNRVEVSVTGAGRLVGLDNGDSTDYDQYKGTSRKLFGGKLLAIIAAKCEPGEIFVEVTAPHLPAARLSLTAEPAELPLPASISQDVRKPVFSCAMANTLLSAAEYPTEANCITENKKSPENNEVPVRKIELKNLGSNHLTKENPVTRVEAVIYPKDASYTELQWRALLLEGIDSNFIKISCEDNIATLTAIGDGEFRLCCASTNGKEHIEVISELEFTASGLGKATLDPYSLVAACLHSDISNEAKLSFQGGVYILHGRNWIQFDNVDFGDYGSDEITLPIFSFDTKFPIEIWEGNPDRGGELLLATEYEHESEYNHYNTNTWKLPKRLRGMQSISILTQTRISLQGFVFTKYEKAYQTIPAVENSRITGDAFTVTADAVTGIGNNVTVEFENMDFAKKGFRTLTVCGRTPNEINAIHVLFRGAEGDVKQMVEFAGCSEYTEQSFTLEPVYGMQTVMLVFLPGSRFDLKWIRFE